MSISPSEQVRAQIRQCVESSTSPEAAKKALIGMGVKIDYIYTTNPVATASGNCIQLQNGQVVSLGVEAFVPEEFVADAGASGVVPAGWKKFQF